MSAIDLVAFGCGRLRPRGGDRRRGTARLLRAAEMWLKTSGSDAGGLAAGEGDCSAGEGEGGAEEPCGAGSGLGGLGLGWRVRVPRPQGRGGVRAQHLGGGGHWRDAGEPEAGRAWEAGARPAEPGG